MTERLSDDILVWMRDFSTTLSVQAQEDIASLVNEVQASRKLVADLLALHHQHAPIAHFSYPYCRACQHPYPCSTVQLIEAGRDG